MTSEMKVFLSELLSTLIVNNKRCITVTRTANNSNTCLIIANIPSSKVCLVGDVLDASMVDVGQWRWASLEGFTMDDIFTDLPDIVFRQVSPGDLHELLI